MPTEPLITIGITCYNAEDTITRAIESARRQDYPHFELVIVDDVSTDASVKIVRDAIVDDPRCRLIVHEINLGPAGARNTIINAAEGVFIMFIDDDDAADPARARLQKQAIEVYESEHGVALVACFASGNRVYDNGYVVTVGAMGSRGVRAPHGPEVADYLFFQARPDDVFFGGGPPSCALMIRRVVFEQIGLYDQALRRVEDVDFAVRLALTGGHFIGVRDRLYTQYVTAGADKSPEKNLEAEQAVVRKHVDYLRRKGRYQYALRWPRLRYWHFKKKYGRFSLELLALLIRHPLAGSRHLWRTGPARLRHEAKMRS